MDTPTKALKAGFLAAALVTALMLSCSSPRRHEVAGAMYGPVPGPEDREGALSDHAPTDKGEDLYLPTKPEKWQKTSDCDPDMDEHLINGACYARMSRKPPCGPKLRRHLDGCYRFVEKSTPKPTSITQ